VRVPSFGNNGSATDGPASIADDDDNYENDENNTLVGNNDAQSKITQMETFDEAIVTEKAATLQTFDEAVVTEKAAQLNRGRHIRSSRPGCVVLAALHPSSKAAAFRNIHPDSLTGGR
jgi:hypothetical protein